ncbi:MAG: hypothetical protein U0X41_10310 [Chitinophagales bacterium]
MEKTYSTCIIPENSEGLLFTLKSGSYLYHCWKIEEKQRFVVIKESGDFSLSVPNQLLNFTERELKRYLYMATEKLRQLDGFLFVNEALWETIMQQG